MVHLPFTTEVSGDHHFGHKHTFLSTASCFTEMLGLMYVTPVLLEAFLLYYQIFLWRVTTLVKTAQSS